MRAKKGFLDLYAWNEFRKATVQFSISKHCMDDDIDTITECEQRTLIRMRESLRFP